MKILYGVIRCYTIFLISLVFFACSENPVENDNPCPPIQIDSHSPYSNPIWYPNGNFIGFNYTPLDSITYPFGENCLGHQHFNYDSTGFWLINIDGTNKRRIFPYQLQTPAWSPNGNWIAFVLGVQIYKMPFNLAEEKFDTTQIQQLTNEGRNFFPTWSPDGEWIAFDNTDCGNSLEPPPDNSCGVLIMHKDGSNKQLISKYSRMPDWNPNEPKIVFIKRAVLSGGTVIGDSLWDYNITNNEQKLIMQLTGVNYDNRYPKFSLDGSLIAFTSLPQNSGKSQIWVINLSNKNKKQLTSKGVGDSVFSWSPDGKKIVYTQHDYSKWSYDNGVLWIIDVNTSTEHQLTFNTIK